MRSASRSPNVAVAAVVAALVGAPAAPLSLTLSPGTAGGEGQGEGSRAAPRAGGSEVARGAESEALVEAAPPPFSPGVFPCSQCHDGEGDRTRRVLAHHEDVQARFEHARTGRWCLDCHDFANRDMLHLSGGELVPFTRSYALCAQCHYGKYRDWRLGIHGKRVGQWDGAKTYLLCVNCHDPHSPAMKPIAPERRPPRPEETRL